MVKILTVSDDGIASGYGRISYEVNSRLIKRGYEILAASLTYDGLLPPMYEKERIPYHVAAMAGKPNWIDVVGNLVQVWQPDIIHVTQDFPYAQGVRSMPLDWSKYGFVITTPVDGTPIYPRWLDVAKQADAVLTISEFGVQAFKAQGLEVGLCRPAANLNTFYPLPADQRAAIRQRLGIAPDAFVLGTVAQNQGRKAISIMIEGFYKFAVDKPNARYLLNMDKVSPGGWDILGMIVEPNGWDASKLIFREDCDRLEVHELRDRYNIMDVHVVLSHREGFGLPIPESQCCGVVAMALDYCSGYEQCGEGKGILIKPIEYTEIGTWGGGRDYFADKSDYVAQLEWAYRNPIQRQALAEAGMRATKQWTWDTAAGNVYDAMERVLARRRAFMSAPPNAPAPSPILPTPEPPTASVSISQDALLKASNLTLAEREILQRREASGLTTE